MYKKKDCTPLGTVGRGMSHGGNGGWGTIFLTPPKHHSDALALGNKSGGDNFRCQNHVLRIDFRKSARKKAKNAPNWTFSTEHCAAANAGDPPRALTAVTTAPSPAQVSGRTPWPARRASRPPWGPLEWRCSRINYDYKILMQPMD